jgi:hypothetical protein
VTTTAFNSLNRMVSSGGGGTITLEGTVSEPATITVAGQALVTNGPWRAAVSAAAGPNSYPITATDANGNTMTRSIQRTGAVVVARSFAHDANGNLTADGSRTYEWDAANRLVAANEASRRPHRVHLRWPRPPGKNVEKTNVAVVGTKQHVWIGGRVAEERDGANAATHRFFTESEQISGSPYLSTRDRLGSIRELVDLTGAIRARCAYDLFVRRAKLSGDQNAAFGFTDHYLRAASQLHLALYRKCPRRCSENGGRRDIGRLTSSLPTANWRR